MPCVCPYVPPLVYMYSVSLPCSVSPSPLSCPPLSLWCRYILSCVCLLPPPLSPPPALVCSMSRQCSVVYVLPLCMIYPPPLMYGVPCLVVPPLCRGWGAMLVYSTLSVVVCFVVYAYRYTPTIRGMTIFSSITDRPYRTLLGGRNQNAFDFAIVAGTL